MKNTTDEYERNEKTKELKEQKPLAILSYGISGMDSMAQYKDIMRKRQVIILLN